MHLRRSIIVTVVLAALMALAMLRRNSAGSASDDIEYHGQKFRLTKAYSDYDDYKNDPDNLAPGQEALIEKAVTEAPLSIVYESEQALTDALFDLKFPGYGMTQFGDKPQADGSVLSGFRIEIPRAGKNRVIVFRGRNKAFTLIDDFVESDKTPIMQVGVQDGKLVYSTQLGKPLITRMPTKP